MEKLGFRRTLRRAFPAKPSCSGVNHHHHKVDPVVLYTVVYPFYRIHHYLTVSHSFFFLRRGIRRTSPWLSLFQAISGHGRGPPRLGPSAAAPGPHPCASSRLGQASAPLPRTSAPPVACSTVQAAGRACSGRQPPAEPAPVQRAAAMGPSAAAAPPAGRQAEAEPLPSLEQHGSSLPWTWSVREQR